jgi:aminopeptidase N
MKKIIVYWIGFLWLFAAQAQDFQNHPNLYRTAENPYYWKNRKPYEGYWQQDVHYKIKANIDDKNNIINGDFFELTYWNNSPHTLQEVYFHLYQNAFQPNSYYHALCEENKVKATFDSYEAKGLGTVCENIQVNGKEVVTKLDNTILQIKLNEPLKPNDSITISMNFRTYYGNGSMRRRMKMFEDYGVKHFDGVHWYPIVCVYDMKFGWTTEQHLDKEFYANFGTFDVALTFPQEYIVEATGNLINESEVLPKELRQKLDLANFKEKPFGEAPSIIIPREEGKTKTWIYHAENVHNFAFTANPTYRIGEVVWNGIRCIALAQEPHASRWQPSAAFTASVIKTYSEDFGMYAWPKIIVADARDGMEYPMITLDGGTYPSHQGLLAHEVGHMWFYGMVANNEQYRAMLDEGFTQFLTSWSMEKLSGFQPKMFGTAMNAHRYYNVYYPYMRYTHAGYDYPLNTHSSDFRGAIRQGGGYGLVYFKTATMLYNLQYVLGDSLFNAAMKHYFNKWKFCHPYPEDFRQAIIEFTQADLNWFFDQWLETTKEIDFSIKKVKRNRKAGTYDITFKRLGEMQMPIDFTITTKSGNKYNYYIPNTWFEKKTNATTLTKWYGWGDKLKPTHTVSVPITEKIKKVEIDTSLRLADVNRMNNVWRFNQNSKLNFDFGNAETQDWTRYRSYIRPDIWYNSFDGIQMGVAWRGNYFGFVDNSSVKVWFNTRLAQQNIPEGQRNKHQLISIANTDSYSLRKIWTGLTLDDYFFWNAGLVKGGITLNKLWRKQDMNNPRSTKAFINFNWMRREGIDSLYLIYPQYWSMNQANTQINMGVIRNYSYQKGKGEVTFEVRTPNVWSEFNYSHVQLQAINVTNLSKFEIKTRLLGRFGYGEFPRESALYLAGAAPEDLYNNKYTRANGFVPVEWTGYGATANHFHMGGGLNLRGYAGRAFTTTNDLGLQQFNYFGKSGAAANIEIDFDRFFAFKAGKMSRYLSLDTYLFGDAGVLTYVNYQGRQQFGSFCTDAGAGAAWHIKFPNLDTQPLIIRFDMPFYVNRPSVGEDNFQWRYVVGLSRSF